MSLSSIIERITSPDLAEDDYGSLLDAVEIINNHANTNVAESLRLVKLKLQSSNGNTLLRTLTLLDFLAENCGAAMKAKIGDSTFIDENLLPILDDNRMHVSVKYQVIKEMYKLSKTFKDDDSLSSMSRAFDDLRVKFPSWTQQAAAEIDGGNKHALPPVQAQANNEEEELKRAIELSLRESGAAATRPQASIPAQPPLNERLSNASHMPIPQVHINQMQTQPQYQPMSPQPPSMQMPVPVNPMQNQLPPAQTQLPISPVESQISGGSFVTALLQEDPNAPEKVIALYDLKSEDEDTLSFQKDDIITVVEKINEDWLRGCLHGNAGIVPVNYVKSIPRTTESDLRELIKSLSSSFEIETTLSKLLDLNKKLKTTPMTSQQFESCLLENQFPTKIQNIEQMKTSFKRVIDLHKIKMMELESIKSNMDSSLETYQTMIKDIAPVPEDPSIAQFINSYPDIGNLSIQSPQPPSAQPFSGILNSNQTGSANAYMRQQN